MDPDLHGRGPAEHRGLGEEQDVGLGLGELVVAELVAGLGRVDREPALAVDELPAGFELGEEGVGDTGLALLIAHDCRPTSSCLGAP